MSTFEFVVGEKPFYVAHDGLRVAWRLDICKQHRFQSSISSLIYNKLEKLNRKHTLFSDFIVENQKKPPEQSEQSAHYYFGFLQMIILLTIIIPQFSNIHFGLF